MGVDVVGTGAAEFVSAGLARRWPAAERVTDTDLASAWAGALAAQPGIVVIAGTGSVAYGRSAEYRTPWVAMSVSVSPAEWVIPNITIEIQCLGI